MLSVGEDGGRDEVGSGRSRGIPVVRSAPARRGRVLHGSLGFVVTGQLGDVTTIALDEHGRTLAYASDGGGTMAVCPGSNHMVELPQVPGTDGQGYRGRAHLVARDLRSFRATQRIRVTALDTSSQVSRDIHALSCTDPEGRSVVVTGTEDGGKMFVLRVLEDGAVEVLFSDRARGATATRDTAYVATTDDRLLAIDLSDGATSTVGTLPTHVMWISVSPDGRRIVATTGDGSGTDVSRPAGGAIVLFPANDPSDRVTVETRIWTGEIARSRIGWSSSETIAWPNEGSIDLLDTRLERLGTVRISFPFEPPRIGAHVYGFVRAGDVTSAFVRTGINGEVEPLNTFPSYLFGEVTAVRGAGAIVASDEGTEEPDQAPAGSGSSAIPSALTALAIAGLIAGLASASIARRRAGSVEP